MKFSELTDEQWEFIKLFLPPSAKTGRPRADDRRTINAILYILKTGCSWIDLPSKYGDDVTAWRRLRRWEQQGIWKKVMDALIVRGYSTGIVKIDLLSVDSSTVPAKKGVS